MHKKSFGQKVFSRYFFIFLVKLRIDAPVAQLDRVAVFETVGCRFESCQAHQPSLLRSYGWQAIFLNDLVFNISTYECASVFGKLMVNFGEEEGNSV